MTSERQLSPLTDIREDQICWLWPDRVPMGAITLLEGDPGQSKSTLTYELAARVTRGSPMPGSEQAQSPAGVVLLQAEDAVGTTVRPSLRSAGADLERIHVYDRGRFIDESLLLPDDLSVIESSVAAVHARLLVLDPLAAFLKGAANSDQGVRKALGPLSAFAERTGLAVVAVRHLTKGHGGNPLYRGGGSIGLIGVARSALLVAHDPSEDDPHKHLLLQLKSNLACNAVTLSFRTVRRDSGVAIEWLGASTYMVKDLVSAGSLEQSALWEGMYVLYSVLSKGPVQAREVIARAASAGIAKRTLDRAKRALHVRVKKRGSGRGSCWTWQLPDDERLLRVFKEKDKDQALDDLIDRLIGRDHHRALSDGEWERDNSETRGDDDEDRNPGSPVLWPDA